ncbi:uncharacterized protein [Rutidosis leptorrhynchoides]|uniref:uncharacterized protein n=1 Tax=Rutidosis leptorrhynchoides TaxID=125765 RepID=UPI003A99D4C6
MVTLERMLRDMRESMGALDMEKTVAQLATFHSGGHSTQIDYLLIRRADLRTCRDCKVLTDLTCSSQHRLLVMDLVLRRRAIKSVRPVKPKILWKKLNGEKAENFKTLIIEKESWWLSDEVQVKVALKQLRFRELITCREGTPVDRTRVEERYKEAKREAKKAVACAKEKAYEDLYRKLDSKEGANDIYRRAKARERRRRDLDSIKFIKDESTQTLVKEDEIRKRWEGYFSSLFIEERSRQLVDLQESDIEQPQNNMVCGWIN